MEMNEQAIIELLLSYNDGNGVSVGSASRLYNEDPRPAERIIETIFSDGSRRCFRRDGKKVIKLCKEDFMRAAVTVSLV
jgi:hypothetical protein